MRVKLKKFGEFINEEFITNNEYRVYKKSKDFYRIEKMIDGKWVEVETDKDIENLLLTDCYLMVNEGGRINTVGGSFKSSEEVPVHAWIECNEYEIGGELKDPDGILYYNPFTVKKFTDRESYESKNPVVIHKCDKIGIKGNYLEYRNATVTVKDKGVLVDKDEEVLTESLVKKLLMDSLIYSPFHNKVNESNNIHWSNKIDVDDVEKYEDIINFIIHNSENDSDSDIISSKKKELLKDIKEKYPNLYDETKEDLDELFHNIHLINILDSRWDELS